MHGRQPSCDPSRLVRTGTGLYTGPLYHKFNLVLRAGDADAPSFLREQYAATCKGNTYTTTLHVLNSCIVKLSKLTVVSKVYRGLSRGVLPEAFWRENQYGVRGGVESAFMSTTAVGQHASNGRNSEPSPCPICLVALRHVCGRFCGPITLARALPRSLFTYLLIMCFD